MAEADGEKFQSTEDNAEREVVKTQTLSVGCEQNCEQNAEEAFAQVCENGQNEEHTQGEVPGRSVFARFWLFLVGKISALKAAVKERGNELKNAKKKRIAVAVGFAVLVVFFVVFYALVGVAIVNLVEDPKGFKVWIEGFDTSGVLIFIGLRVIMTVLRVIPGGALQIAGGYAFGTWWGAVWCMAGSLIGTLIIFLLGKKYGTKLVGLFVSPEKMRSATMLKDKKKRNVFLFLVNFVPGTPKDIFTWMAAISNDGALSSMLVILLARIPSVLASTWCGDALMQENYLISAVVFCVLLALGIVCSCAYKKLSDRHSAHIKPRENAEKEGN